MDRDKELDELKKHWADLLHGTSPTITSMELSHDGEGEIYLKLELKLSDFEEGEPTTDDMLWTTSDFQYDLFADKISEAILDKQLEVEEEDKNEEKPTDKK